MGFKVTFSDRFQKSYRKLSETNRKQVKNKIRLLCENPMHPSLRTKRIQGSTNLFECSVNMDIRIIWYYEEEEIIILLDIGHHSILNRY